MRIIGRRAQAPHQGLERLALDILHHYVEFIARTATINDPRQVFKTAPGTLGLKQALIRPANLGRCVNALTDEGAKRPTARTLKVDELSCFDR